MTALSISLDCWWCRLGPTSELGPVSLRLCYFGILRPFHLSCHADQDATLANHVAGAKVKPLRCGSKAMQSCVRVALSSGKIRRAETCKRCGRPASAKRGLEPHYHRGFVPHFIAEVEWLCRECHHMTHIANGVRKSRP